MVERVGRLCAHLTRSDLEEFEKRADRYGAAAPLARIITAVRSGIDPATLESDLDALDEAFARHGVDYLTSTFRTYRPLPGVGRHLAMRAWVCPAPQPCPRVILPTRASVSRGLWDGLDAPTCALTGRDFILADV